MIALAAPVPAPNASAQAGGLKPTVVLVHGAWADTSSPGPVADLIRSAAESLTTP
jgi:hypothetical protein